MKCLKKIKITRLDKKVCLDNLIYRYKGPVADVKFDEFDNALNFLDKIREAEISLAKAKVDQINFKSNLGKIKKGNKIRDKKNKKRNALYNIGSLYKACTKSITYFDDYSSVTSDAKHEVTKGTGLKILTPKQMLQRLPIDFAQVKEGNNSEKLLNKIRKIFNSLYQS